jgi:hypothetical protein
MEFLTEEQQGDHESSRREETQQSQKIPANQNLDPAQKPA